MATWQELERESHRKQEAKRREEELARQEAERQRRIAEQQKQEEQELEARIRRIEAERWGTPEVAYNTWEKRARALVDVVPNNIANSLLQQSQEARRLYGPDTFPCYIYRERGFFNRKIVKERVGLISISEFSYSQKGSDPHYYELRRYGTPVRLSEATPYASHPDGHFERNTINLENSHRFEEILREIFVPEIQARLLRTGDSPLIKYAQEFFEFGQSLKRARSYSFRCRYLGKDLEDKYTDLRFDNITVKIPNPVKVDTQDGSIVPGVYIAIMYQTPYSGESRGSQV